MHACLQHLNQSMQEHLQMHIDMEDGSDEAVLQIYPAAIRRRVLRHLYLDHLTQSFLFKRCPKKFLDVLLSGERG